MTLLFIIFFVQFFLFQILKIHYFRSSQMFLLIILLLVQHFICMNITTSQIVLSTPINDYGVDWAVDYTYNSINSKNLSGSTRSLAIGQIVRQVVCQSTFTNNSKFAVTNYYGILKIYQFVNSSLMLIDDTNQAYSKVVFGKDPFIYTISQDKYKVQKIDVKTKKSVKNYSFSQETAQDIHFQTNLVIMTKINWTSTGNLYLFDQNLVKQKKLNFSSYNFSDHKSLRYDLQTNTVVLTSALIAKLWSLDTLFSIKSVSKAPKLFNTLQSSTICNGYLIVLQSYFYSFYKLSTWQKMNITQPNIWRRKTNIKCFKNANKVGFYSQDIYRYEKLIKYISFASISTPKLKQLPQNITVLASTFDSTLLISNETLNMTQTNPILEDYNFTNATNTTQDTQQVIRIDNINQTVQNIPIKSEFTQNLNKISSVLTSAVLSEDSKKGTSLLCSTAGVTSAATITKPALRPAINLFQDLWFYGYHQKIYPQFVMLFTAEVDIFNELRIKPQFINTSFSIQKYQQQNDKYNASSILQSRAPDQIFMLETIKDVYTVNLGLVLIAFLVFNGLKFVIGLISVKNGLINSVYKVAYINSLWWTLLIGFFQTNIVPISFYGAIQLNVFVCFDTFSKFNNVFTVLMLFMVLAFCFLFYPIIKQYGKKEDTQQFFEFCKLDQQSFWLQMTLKCLRGLFQSLIHGFFINRNLVQLSGLIFLDISLMAAIFFFRNKFAHKITFILFFLYYFLFLIFDTCLLSFTIKSTFDTEFNQQVEDKYNFAFVVIILSLFVVTILKLIAILGIFLSQIIIGCQDSNKISNQLKDQNMKKDSVKSYSCKEGGQFINQFQNKKTIYIKNTNGNNDQSKIKHASKNKKKLKGTNLLIKFKSQQITQHCRANDLNTKKKQQKINDPLKRRRIGTDMLGNSNGSGQQYKTMRNTKTKQQFVTNVEIRQQKILATFRRERQKDKNHKKINI